MIGSRLAGLILGALALALGACALDAQGSATDGPEDLRAQAQGQVLPESPVAAAHRASNRPPGGTDRRSDRANNQGGEPSPWGTAGPLSPEPSPWVTDTGDPSENTDGPRK